MNLTRVIIYDRVHDGDVPAMNARVTACYEWAELHGMPVLDEHLDWRPTNGCPALLAKAIDSCRERDAGLLVYSCAVLDAAPHLSVGLREQLVRLAVMLLIDEPTADWYSSDTS